MPFSRSTRKWRLAHISHEACKQKTFPETPVRQEPEPE
jgi:hypothetical protein